MIYYVLFSFVREYICFGLAGKNDEQIEKGKIMKLLFGDLLVLALGEPKDSPFLHEIKDAIVFEVTSKLLKTPMDILGQRRVAELQNIIEETILQYEQIEPFKNKHITTFIKENLTSIRFWGEKRKLKLFGALKTTGERNERLWLIKIRRIQWGIILPICLSICFYNFDYYTDIEVTALYACQFVTLVHQNTSFCNFFLGPAGNKSVPRENWFDFRIEDAKNVEDLYFVLEKNIGIIFMFSSSILGILLVVALLVTIPTLKTLRYQFNIKSSMKNKKAEEGTIVISEEEVSRRFNVSFTEATIEGSLQLCFQMSTFLSCSWVLNWFEKNIRRPEEHSVYAIQFSAIWISATMSLLSQSWAQYKRRMILHEYSDDGLKKFIFLCASALNTILAMILLISCTTAWYDMQVLLQLRRMHVHDDVADSLIVLLVIGAIGYFCVRLAIARLGNALRLPTTTTYPDIMTVKSMEFKDELRNQCFGICLINWFTALLNIHNFIHYSNQNIDQDGEAYINLLQFGKILANTSAGLGEFYEK